MDVDTQIAHTLIYAPTTKPAKRYWSLGGSTVQRGARLGVPMIVFLYNILDQGRGRIGIGTYRYASDRMQPVEAAENYRYSLPLGSELVTRRFDLRLQEANIGDRRWESENQLRRFVEQAARRAKGFLQ